MSIFRTRRGPKPIHKLLIANRGEVAVRVIRTARELGITSVAVYSDQDMRSQACDLADEAYALGGSAPADTYLSANAILQAAKKTGADAIHPGYGFLSEDPEFASAVHKAGLTWVGPKASAIRALGNKISARSIAASSKVPVIPGGPLPAKVSEGLGATLQFARRHGYPILIKRADAGGGRGITRFDNDEDVRRHFQGLEDSALKECFLEKMVLGARHVETQCARDTHLNFRVVSTRDCSVQRRNQKIIEEAPAPHLPAGVEEALENYSRALFEAIDYTGVGTCEFLVSADSHIYFLEVNPRLQVEHTVSEEVSGLDLVAEQLRIASGQPLSEPTHSRGHSIEVRITSENPADDLMPATGRIRSITWPGGPGVRVDSFVRAGDSIGSDYDSLIAKLIVTGPNRSLALARLLRAIDEFTVEGLPTSAPMLTHILTHPDFCGPDSPRVKRANGSASSQDEDAPAHWKRWPKTRSDFAVYTKWFEDLRILDEVKEGLCQEPGTRSDRGEVPVEEMQSFTIEIDGRRAVLKVPSGFFAGPRGTATADSGEQPTRRQLLRGRGARKAQAHTTSGPSLRAPIQATVVRVLALPGQKVAAGDLVLVLESMKMEKPILAHEAGQIVDIHVKPGDTVKAGDLMVSINPIEEAQ